MTTLQVRFQTAIQTQLFSGVIGFDGFIDSIVRIVHRRGESGNVLFQSMEEWTDYIKQRTGKNFSLELLISQVKLGGNMPIMAVALAKLGVNITGVGALGYPQWHPVFVDKPANCNWLSFANPGMTQALEFDRGKIILGEMESLNAADWSTIQSRVDMKTLIEAVDYSQLLAIVNWGELKHSTDYWNGLLTDVLPFCKKGNQRVIFFDLSDITKKSDQEVRIALGLVSKFKAFGRVMLGMNLNEAEGIARIIGVEHSELQKLASYLATSLGLDTVVIHHRTEAVAATESETISVTSRIVDNPVLLTGAGDNFNAGFCWAQLAGFSLTDSLTIAHAQSRFYITNGFSPTLKQLEPTLE